jgi:hypothetical protein
VEDFRTLVQEDVIWLYLDLPTTYSKQVFYYDYANPYVFPLDTFIGIESHKNTYLQGEGVDEC